MNQAQQNLKTKFKTIDFLKSIGYKSDELNAAEFIINLNLHNGGSFLDISNALKEYAIVNNLKLKFFYEFTTEVIARYNAVYSVEFSNDLNLEWYVYTGSLLTTSRIFCKACVAKRYIHKSEFQKIISGDFEEYKELNGKHQKNGLAKGINKFTTIDNFIFLIGGEGCMHSLIPVDEIIVPQHVKNKLKLYIVE